MSCINDYMNNMQYGMFPQNKTAVNSPFGGGIPSGGLPVSGGIPAQSPQVTLQQPHPQNGMVLGVSQPLPMPTGFATGGNATPTLPTAAGLPSTVTTPSMPGAIQVPATVESPLYTPGFLRTQIGRRVRVEFLIGTTNMTDRTGTLVAVGASFILIRPVDSDDLMMCDIYSIKFVTIIL